MTTTDSPTAVHRFRCLDDGHEIAEPRKADGPLVARQSTWCTEHDCPAVGLGSVEPAAADHQSLR